MEAAREALPIAAFRRPIVERLRADERVLLVLGETGSGKTTQLAQYLLDDGLVPPGMMVAVTQPRRIAAITAARRVAEERGSAVGDEVAHTVRFDDTCSARTRIRFITDGCLLREALDARALGRYACIVLDEAHERSLSTDVLFGLLRRLLRSGARPDLRLVVASATLDASKFAAFFGAPPDAVVRAPGRTHAVSVFYAAAAAGGGGAEAGLRGGGGGAGGAEPSRYVEESVELALRLHAQWPVGPNHDLLIFLTGADEIALACAALEELARGGAAGEKALRAVALHAALPSDAHARAFAPSSAAVRKVIVATNIAETSVTLDGVRAVIDCGLAKVRRYDARRGMDVLGVEPISKASARQRAGRAGRTRAGECYRLYTEREYAENFPEASDPEIRRTSLSAISLSLKAMGEADLLGFDFVDPPPRRALLGALRGLHAIGALDDAGAPTPLGARIARLPVDPRLGAALDAAAALGCLEQMATVAAMLSGEEPFVRRAPGAGAGVRGTPGAHDAPELTPLARARARMLAEAAAAAAAGDAGGAAAAGGVQCADQLLLLRLYERWAALGGARGAQDAWAREWGVHARAMRAARDVRAQLLELARRAGLRADRPAAAAAPPWQPAASAPAAAAEAEPLERRLRRALCAGYFANAARRVGTAGMCVALASEGGGAAGGGGGAGGDAGARGGGALVHAPPDSEPVLSGSLCFVYHELVWTGSAVMRYVCRVEERWLEAPLARLAAPVDALVLAGARRAERAAADVRAPAAGVKRRAAGADGVGGAERERGSGADAGGDGAQRRNADDRVAAARARFLQRAAAR